jgi:hypothetical protein
MEREIRRVMEGERWRERGSAKFRLREMEREWGVFEFYKEKMGVLEVDGEGILDC